MLASDLAIISQPYLDAAHTAGLLGHVDIAMNLYDMCVGLKPLPDKVLEFYGAPQYQLPESGRPSSQRKSDLFRKSMTLIEYPIKLSPDLFQDLLKEFGISKIAELISDNAIDEEVGGQEDIEKAINDLLKPQNDEN